MEKETNNIGSEETTFSGETMPARRITPRKVFGVLLEIVLYLFLAFSLFMLVLTLVSKRNSDGAVSLFGYEMRIVVSSSMEKSDYSIDVDEYEIKDLKVKSMVFVERVPEDAEEAKEWYASLKKGDVLTFRYVIGSSQETITHRIVEIAPTENGFLISLQGDNRGDADAVVSTQTIYTSPEDYPSDREHFNYVIGKVVGSNAAFGNIMYAVKQPVGLALIVIVPCTIIIIWQIVRVVLVVTEEKKEKTAKALDEANRQAALEAEERARQAEELEALKRRFAELERQGVVTPDGRDKDDHAED